MSEYTVQVYCLGEPIDQLRFLEKPGRPHATEHESLIMSQYDEVGSKMGWLVFVKGLDGKFELSGFQANPNYVHGEYVGMEAH